MLAGKGHETYQVRGTTALPFDERRSCAPRSRPVSDELLRPAGAPGFWTLDRVAAALDGGAAGGHGHGARRRAGRARRDASGAGSRLRGRRDRQPHRRSTAISSSR